MRRLGTLPLMHQPGERWQYHISNDLLGVLVARVTGKSLETFLRERIFEPLGMKDTGFHVPADKIDRLPPLYAPDPQTGEFIVWDEAKGGRHSQPPAFQGGGGGLSSTVDDYHAYFQMLLNHGMHGTERILSRPAVQLMTTNRLTHEQQAARNAMASNNVHVSFGQGQHGGWGFGMAVALTVVTTLPSASSAGTVEPAPRHTPTRTNSSPESCSPRSGCPPRIQRDLSTTSGPWSTRQSKTDNELARYALSQPKTPNGQLPCGRLEAKVAFGT